MPNEAESAGRAGQQRIGAGQSDNLDELRERVVACIYLALAVFMLFLAVLCQDTDDVGSRATGIAGAVLICLSLAMLKSEGVLKEDGK